jgi:hypothetical protein
MRKEKTNKEKEMLRIFKWGFISLLFMEIIIFFLLFSFGMRVQDDVYDGGKPGAFIGVTFAEGFFSMVCAGIGFILSWLIRGLERIYHSAPGMDEMSKTELEERILIHKRWIEKIEKKELEEQKNKNKQNLSQALLSEVSKNKGKK